MDHDPPRPVTDALRLLLETCLRVAEERDDVGQSLVTLNAWLSRELDAMGRRGRRVRGPSSHGVLTPAGRGRGDQPGEGAAGGDGGRPGARITERLVTVVTRARWKAAACRLSLDKGAQVRDGSADAAAEAQIAKREASLRARLAALPDTSTWMLDLPFGRRVSEEGALDVDDAQAEGLERVADCYDTLATGAEIAIQLDEAGAFRRSPPPQFLYLLAEAQSALLQSLDGAPTRSDSDQRDVFLWLKDQTTRYRIYVDRYMRLDDPADPAGSKDLVERLRRSSREILAKAKERRKRSQLLSKVRYHVSKVLHQPIAAELESLRAGLAEWDSAGFDRSHRGLLEALAPLRELGERDGVPGEVAEALRGVVDGPAPERRRPRPPAEARAEGRGPGDRAARERGEKVLGEVRELLASRSVTLFVEVGREVDVEAHQGALGARELRVVELDMEAGADERAALLGQELEGDGELYLLGVRLPPEEYRVFKEGCLSREKQFVRLPGALEPHAIAHQVSRQVGWRLRAQKPSPGTP